MEQKRININDIVLGGPLRWDVYDVANNLLLRKGYVVENLHQIEALIERGLFIDAKFLAKKADEPVPDKPQERPSVVRFINIANRRLERLLINLHNESDIQEKILEVVKVIIFAVDVNADVALACILHNQGTRNYAVRHSVDTAVVSLLVGRSMKKTPEDIQTMMCAALTMNVGMHRHQEQFQNRASALTEEEREIIRKHPEDSVNMLKHAGISNQEWLSYVLLHHENEDGSGYPLGRTSQEIPENAKIIAISDRYCARVSSRHYRKSLLPNAALRDILLADKKNIDPALAASFIRVLGVYPTGTFVKLQDGEIGIVTGKGSSTTTPIVHALIGPRGVPLSFPIKRDTAITLHSIREVLHEAQASIRVSMQQIWGNEAAA